MAAAAPGTVISPTGWILLTSADLHGFRGKPLTWAECHGLDSAHVSRSSRIPWRTSHVSGMSRRSVC